MAASRGEYQVFLNFRGPDTRYGFTDFLYHGLVDAGVHVFRDYEELRVRDVIGGELLQAIDNSILYIPIFSQTYASSKWCLREIAHIVDSVSKSDGKKSILPIFFRVEPESVKLKTPLYSNALLEHTVKFPKEVEAWRKALEEVGKIKGWNVKKDQSQAEIVRLVVKNILEKLEIKQKSVTDHLVGLVDQERDLAELLDVKNPDVRLIGIYGMGGIGKTTFAKYIFNKLSSHFGRCCSFLENVRESMLTEDGIVRLQKKVLSDIVGSGYVEKVEDKEKGTRRLGEILCTNKVLVVLDDVNNKELIKNLTGNYSLYSGSRIIITTRDTTIFQVDEFKGRILQYEMPKMGNNLALQLFCRHAFGTDFPSNNYRSLSSDILSLLGGLPLAIEVVGSLLKGKDENFWNETLDRLRKVPEKEIQEKLKISYDGLDKYQQQIFLDIACFFSNENKTDAIYMWTDYDLYPQRGIHVLTSRCLIKILDNDTLWMHDQLIELGRQLVRQESPSDLGKRSRLWIAEEALKIVKAKENKDKVEALEIGGWNDSIKITNEELERLQNLRFLKLRNGTFVGDFAMCHLQLRWISWHSPDEDFRAENMYLCHLLVFKLDSSGFADNSKAWDLIKMAQKLKALSLTWCYRITRIPNLFECLGLERLNLAHCDRLTEIGNFIGDLPSLIELKIENCNGLTNLPKEVGALVMLKCFSLSGCSRLRELPDSLGNLTSLIELDLSRTGVAKLPNYVEKLKSLRILRLSKDGLLSQEHHVWRLPSGISVLENLEELDLSGNDEMEGEIPRGMGDLSRLRILNLEGTRICKIPRTINMLHLLQTLNLRGCHVIKVVPELPTSLTCLLIESRSLLSVPNLSNLTNLVELLLSDGSRNIGKSNLITGCNLCWMERLSRLKRLDLNLLNFPAPSELVSLSHLEELTLSHLALETLKELPSSLLKLIVKFFSIRMAESLPSCLILSNLSTLEFYSAEVENIPLDGLPQLETLIIHDCKLLQRLFIPLELGKLRQACVACCPELVAIEVADLSKSLECFSILRCISLRRVNGLNKLKSLRYVKVRECMSSLIDASCTSLADNCVVDRDECGDSIKGYAVSYQLGKSTKRYRKATLPDTSNKPPVTTVVLKFSGRGLHCERCIQKIRNTITQTKGVLKVAIDRNWETATVKGVMDAKALAENLRYKMKRKVEIVPQKKEEEGEILEEGEIVLQKKEKEGGEAKDKEGGGCHKEAEIIGGWGKVEGQRMEFRGACGYGQCVYGERTHLFAPDLHDPYTLMFSDKNTEDSCSVM
ncbi:TMV resistance protein N-like [Eucalyptus grandis]|uniref:TMV resistance protein N-like n=1 Tax=Eucalyptus grandis TaxID=71139 RepID=UPI00192EB9BF|nr:TMV resistance protein N-like [Eucalyptus grandis]